MRVLLTGAAGFLGRAAARRLGREHEVVAATRRGEPLPGCARVEALDLADPEAAGRLVVSAAPDAVLHLGAVSKLEPCEKDPAGTRRVNVEAAAAMARAAAVRGAAFYFASSEQVHAGDAAPYGDDAPASPLHAYGRQKAEAEALVAAAGGLSVRIALCYGLPEPGSPPNFCSELRAALSAGRRVNGFTDQRRSYLYSEDAAELFARLLGRGIPPGRRVLNFAGPEGLGRFDFAVRFAGAMGLDASLVVPVRAADAAPGQPRPADVSLDAARLFAWTGFTPDGVAAGLSRMAAAIR